MEHVNRHRWQLAKVAAAAFVKRIIHILASSLNLYMHQRNIWKIYQKLALIDGWNQRNIRRRSSAEKEA